MHKMAGVTIADIAKGAMDISNSECVAIALFIGTEELLGSELRNIGGTAMVLQCIMNGTSF